MSEVAEICYGLDSGSGEREYELKTDKAKRRAQVVKAVKTPTKHLLINAEHLAGALLPASYKWDVLKGEVLSLAQENSSVQKETASVAIKFLDLLEAHGLPPEEASMGPAGEIDFDWTRSKDWSFTVSICPNQEIAYAGIFDIKGCDLYDSAYELPDVVIAYLEAFKRVNKEADE